MRWGVSSDGCRNGVFLDQQDDGDRVAVLLTRRVQREGRRYEALAVDFKLLVRWCLAVCSGQLVEVDLLHDLRDPILPEWRETADRGQRDLVSGFDEKQRGVAEPDEGRDVCFQLTVFDLECEAVEVSLVALIGDAQAAARPHVDVLIP